LGDSALRSRGGIHRRSPWAAAAFLLAFLLSPALLLANGGTLRFFGLVGPYQVAVFTDPTPVRPDSTDVSLLVTEPGELVTVDDLTIRIRVEGMDHHPREPQEVRATRDQAEDPRYYAAKFHLAGPGEWRVLVELRDRQGEGGELEFTLTAREAGVLDHPAVLFLLALLPLALVGWWLRRGGRGETRR